MGRGVERGGTLGGGGEVPAAGAGEKVAGFWCFRL